MFFPGSPRGRANHRKSPIPTVRNASPERTTHEAHRTKNLLAHNRSDFRHRYLGRSHEHASENSSSQNPWKKAFMLGGLTKGSPLATFQLLKDAGFGKESS